MLMNRRACTVGASVLAFTLGSDLALGLVEVGPGDWPSSWPKELEPYRKRAETRRGPLGPALISHRIPFSDRDDFEKAWPALLKVKTKGASLTLRSAAAAIVTIRPADRSGYRLELAVDGKVIDLNRIRLPADTPIIDNRALPSPQTQPSTQPAAKRPERPRPRTIKPKGQSTRAEFFGPIPYLSFNDSPFKSPTFDYFHLEDFEDGGGKLNTPGARVSGGNPDLITHPLPASMTPLTPTMANSTGWAKAVGGITPGGRGA